MGSSGESFYYHYTSTAGANAIRCEGRLQSGVQLSILKPEEHTRGDILRAIYGNQIPKEFKNRADNVVYIDEADLDTKKLLQITPDLYQYSGEIEIHDDDVRDKPRCLNGTNNWAPNDSAAQKMFFYTNTSNAQVIKRSRVIPYEGNRPIFLTTMKPQENFRDEILNTIYGRDYDRVKFASSADWCVSVDNSTLNRLMLRVSKHSSKVYEYVEHLPINPANVKDKPQCTKNRSSGDAHKYLYHYTNYDGAQAIIAAGYLKKSGASGAFGPGVYMTKLKPTDFFRDDILKNNYGDIKSAFKSRADWVVRIKKSDLINKKLKTVPSTVTGDDQRQILVYSDIVKVQAADVFLKPKCYRA